MLGLKILTILLLVLLPFGEFLRFSIGNDIHLRPLDITACLLTLGLTMWLVYTRKLKKELHWPLLLFPLIGLLSLAVNSIWLRGTELLVASFYLIRWVGYLGILFVIPQFDTGFKRRLHQLLFLDGLLLVIIGYFQYFFYSDIRSLIVFGWDDHMYRLFSSFYDPNFAGAFLVLYSLFVAGTLYEFITKKNKKGIIFCSIVLFLTLIAILLTFSRSALIMLVLSGGLMLVLLKQKKLIFALLAMLVLYVVIISPQFYIENTNLFRTASTGARLETYTNAMTIYQDRPIFGVGFNGYRYAQQDYGFRQEKPKYPSNADAGVDNSFLFVLATTGIIGFAAFLTMWGSIIKTALIHLRSKHKVFAIVFLASTLGLFFNALFINSLFFPAILLWMWILYGIMQEEK